MNVYARFLLPSVAVLTLSLSSCPKISEDRYKILSPYLEIKGLFESVDTEYKLVKAEVASLRDCFTSKGLPVATGANTPGVDGKGPVPAGLVSTPLALFDGVRTTAIAPGIKVTGAVKGTYQAMEMEGMSGVVAAELDNTTGFYKQTPGLLNNVGVPNGMIGFTITPPVAKTAANLILSPYTLGRSGILIASTVNTKIDMGGVVATDLRGSALNAMIFRCYARYRDRLEIPVKILAALKKTKNTNLSSMPGDDIFAKGGSKEELTKTGSLYANTGEGTFDSYKNKYESIYKAIDVLHKEIEWIYGAIWEDGIPKAVGKDGKEDAVGAAADLTNASFVACHKASTYAATTPLALLAKAYGLKIAKDSKAAEIYVGFLKSDGSVEATDGSNKHLAKGEATVISQLNSFLEGLYSAEIVKDSSAVSTFMKSFSTKEIVFGAKTGTEASASNTTSTIAVPEDSYLPALMLTTVASVASKPTTASDVTHLEQIIPSDAKTTWLSTLGDGKVAAVDAKSTLNSESRATGGQMGMVILFYHFKAMRNLLENAIKAAEAVESTVTAVPVTPAAPAAAG